MTSTNSRQMPSRPNRSAPPLRLLFWESTARCNLACIHCRRLDVAEEAARDDLSTDEFRSVLDSAATLGRPIIVFSGGEPLMRDDWEPLAAHAASRGLPTALATNGTMIDDALARRRQAAGGIELKATCAPHYYRLAAQRGVAPKHSRGCLCGVAVVFVSHKGDVFPCGYLPVSCGSVRQRPLADIWRDAEVFADLRDYARLEGKCGRCEYRGVCGGCRARAYALTGNYLAAEPACTYRPKGP